jgi:hypothetical protein
MFKLLGSIAASVIVGFFLASLSYVCVYRFGGISFDSATFLGTVIASSVTVWLARFAFRK